MTEAVHAPLGPRKRERRCTCGARFDTPQKLRRHVRAETVDPRAEPTVWAAVPIPRGPQKRRRR